MDTIHPSDAYTVTSLDDLAKIYAKPLPHVATKETDHITEVGRALIAASPFLALATSNGTNVDCSPKGGLRAAARRPHTADSRQARQ